MLSVCSVVQRPGQLWGCCRPCLLCKPLNSGRGHPSCYRPFHRVGVYVEALCPSFLFRRASREKGDFPRPSPPDPLPPSPSAARSPRFCLTSQGCRNVPAPPPEPAGKAHSSARGEADGLRARGVSLGAEVLASRSGTARSPGSPPPSVPWPTSLCFWPSQCRSDTELGEKRGEAFRKVLSPAAAGPGGIPAFLLL